MSPDVAKCPCGGKIYQYHEAESIDKVLFSTDTPNTYSTYHPMALRVAELWQGLTPRDRVCGNHVTCYVGHHKVSLTLVTLFKMLVFQISCQHLQ